MNNNLTSVRISNSITILNNSVFSDNYLREIEIPTSVTTIGTYSLAANELEEIVIPDSVTFIEQNAFKINNYLTSVTIPASVTEIEGSAFDDAPNLVEISIYGVGVTLGLNLVHDSNDFRDAYIANGPGTYIWNSGWTLQ